MSSKQIGYIRVSTAHQNTDRQLEGVQLDKVFEEKASGRNATGREILTACLDFCREDDTLHIHSIDRLARNLRDLQGIVTSLISKGTTVRFHKENLTFSGNRDDPIATLTLHLLGAFAEFENTLIANRRREGIEAARKRGKQIGRPNSLSDEQIAEILQKISQGAQKKELAKEYGVSRTTLYAALAAFKEAHESS